MNKLVTLSLLAVLFSSLNSAALADQIFKVINSDGSVSYSDQPPTEGASEEVALPDIFIFPPVAVPSPASTSNNSSAEAQAKEIRIHTPLDEAVLHGSDNRLSIRVSVTPTIAEDESLQLIHNGNPYGPEQSSAQWNLARLNPGTQKFSVQLVDTSGRVLSQSTTITVYVIL